MESSLVRQAADGLDAHVHRRPLSIAMIGTRGLPASYGGVERAVEELSAALVCRGHRVTVFNRTAYSEQRVGTHRGVEIKYLPQINTKHLEAISHTFVALLAALRRKQFDVIHVHATGPALLSFVPRLRGVPTVATVQGLDWRREKWGPVASNVLKAGAYASATFPNKTIVVSRELQRHYRDVYGIDAAYIPNGVDRADFQEMAPVSGLVPDRFLLFLGRLVPEKHVHTLLKAYRRVETDVPLVIAGVASHSSPYVQQVMQLVNDDPRARFLGGRYGAEKAWLLRNATAFIQPSSIEGLPIALLEALACGRYPLVSNIPENLEPVTTDRGAQGISFPPGDEVALARAIDQALRKTDRVEVGRELQTHMVRSYDWAKIAAETSNIYRAVINARSSAAGFIRAEGDL